LLDLIHNPNYHVTLDLAIALGLTDLALADPTLGLDLIDLGLNTATSPSPSILVA
jgi:hypothetical protein